jgi:hypothetical protein
MSDKQKAQMQYLLDNHWGEWMDTRRKVFELKSNAQPYRCVCGRLATGLHERTCARFRHAVDAATIKALKHLLKEVQNG